ncbi:MAG: CZB domain-containing protein [Hydrogenophilus thermoluteolus]
MGIFDWLEGLAFFRGRDITGIREEDLDFDKWRNAHRVWRQRLQRVMKGEEPAPDPALVEVDNRCELGQWIHGPGKRFYGDLPVFQELIAEHAAFHRAAAQILRHWQEGDMRAARRLLNGEYEMRSMRVISDLTELERIILGR